MDIQDQEIFQEELDLEPSVTEVLTYVPKVDHVHAPTASHAQSGILPSGYDLFDNASTMYMYRNQDNDPGFVDASQPGDASGCNAAQNHGTKSSNSQDVNVTTKGEDNRGGGRGTCKKYNMVMTDQDRLVSGKRLGESSSKERMVVPDEDVLYWEAAAEGSPVTQSNKQARNEKEKLRRVTLKASFSALRDLLPNSKRSKKRWSAPKIIEKALTYIPELLGKVEILTLEKDTKRLSNTKHSSQSKLNNTPSLTITEVSSNEFIIQICTKRGKDSSLSDLMNKVEEEGMSIIGASSANICTDLICCHLHIEIDAASSGSDKIIVLRDKLASWFY